MIVFFVFTSFFIGSNVLAGFSSNDFSVGSNISWEISSIELDNITVGNDCTDGFYADLMSDGDGYTASIDADVVSTTSTNILGDDGSNLPAYPTTSQIFHFEISCGGFCEEGCNFANLDPYPSERFYFITEPIFSTTTPCVSDTATGTLCVIGSAIGNSSIDTAKSMFSNWWLFTLIGGVIYFYRSKLAGLATLGAVKKIFR